MSKKAKIAKLKAENKYLKQQIRISHPGSLSKFGFNLHESIAKQKQSLERADDRYGMTETDRKLAALEVLDKHRKHLESRIKEILRWNEEE